MDILSNEELKYDTKYHKLELGMNNQNTTISPGKVTTIAQVIAVPFDTYAFELHTNVVLDSVKVNGVLKNVTSNGDSRLVDLAGNLNLNDIFTAEIFYHGSASSGGGFFSGISNAQSNNYSNSRTTWTLSEPYSALEWWPCKQLLTDKIDSSDVWITVASNLKAGSNGNLVNITDVQGGKKRYEWKSRHPIDYYLISAAVSTYQEFNVYAHPAAIAPDSVLIQNYLYNDADVLDDWQTNLEKTADIIEHFSDLYGLYPFYNEKYGHCQAPLGGGMEHQTMTTCGFFNIWLISHELGHQWWGDNVTCANWGHIWVNEGFASYSEFLSYSAFYPASAVTWMEDVHANVLSEPDGSVFCPDTTDENRIFDSRLTYDKGGAIIHTLRFEVNNDSLFFASLRQYQTQFANGTAVAEDVQGIFENVTGLTLTDFFSQWFYGEGFPTFNINWNQENGQTILKLSETVSMPNVTPFFKTSLELKLNSPQGDTTVRVFLSQNGDIFHFNWDNTLNGIETDPNQWVLNMDGALVKDTSLHALPSGMEENTTTPLAIYPVPAKDQLVISAAKAVKNITVYDMAGRQINTYTGTGEKTTLDISNLTTGAYIVEVRFMGNAMPVKRLIVKE